MSIKSFDKLTDNYSNRIYQLTFSVSILILIAMLVYRLMLLFTYNGEIGGIDNNFVYAVLRGIAGYSMYPDPALMPYAVNPYSPLYFNLCVSIGKILNINIEEPITVYQLCRTVSFVCDLLTVFVFFRIIQKNTSLKKEITYLTTAVFFSLLCYLGYTFSRADSLFLLFYALVFYVLITGNIQKKTSSIILLALLTTACIFSKQNGIILALLIPIWLFLNDSFKKSLLYLGILALCFTGTLGFYKYVLGDSFITSHTIHAVNNKLDLSWFYVYIFKRFSDSLLLIPIYIAAGISITRLRKGATAEKTLGILFLIQTVFSLGASLKFGASAGYFNESFFLGLIIICQYFSSAKITSQDYYAKKILAWSLPLILLFSVHVLAQGYLFFLQNQDEKKAIYTAQSEIRNYIRPKLNGKKIFNLGNQNGDFFKTLFYKEAVVPNYDAVDCCTLPDNTFDYSKLKADLQNGEIKYLLMLDSDIQSAIWGVPLEKYKRDTAINGYILYKYHEE